MKTIDFLVQELPTLGGWPEGAIGAGFLCGEGMLYFWDENGDCPSKWRIDTEAEVEDSASEVSREQYEAALAAKNDGWIEWGGGECPVADFLKVEYQLRAGAKGSESAKILEWQHEGGRRDIISYRLHKQKEAEQDKANLNECIGQDATPAWSGEGLPPVGCVCEVLYDEHEVLGNTWLKAKIISHDDGNVVGRWLEGNTEHTLFDYAINHRDYRPLRTEADKKRDAAVMAINNTVDASGTLGSEIYDAIAAGNIPGVKLEGL